MPKARRSELWTADLGFVAKVRPLLVLSVDFRDDERAVVTYVLRTTSVRGTQYEVPHLSGDSHARSYFPMQKVLKIVPRMSSISAFPAISPMASMAERNSTARISAAAPPASASRAASQ